jgi:hypothetical protein
MKRKIDLYALKVRNSTPHKDPPKRKLSLSRHSSNKKSQPPTPLHILQLANYESTQYTSTYAPSTERKMPNRDSRMHSTTVSINSARSTLTVDINGNVSNNPEILWSLNSPVNSLIDI